MMEEPKIEREYKTSKGPFEAKLEGLENGYRITLKGDPEKLRRKRQVKASFVDFLKKADVSGYPILFPFNLLLRFFARYKNPVNK
ncbi:hypothetical protein [Jeotgalibacillus sp. R-1-5s-1]|uniref:hypothetical protein n=1 Tax=Jeotgalibacillus sp. R-1-5s-1 TaxID=2555897 RepID=UPI001069245F|nr:hypothetical protein [Jeotgalibacillus sp. R-1-5s-1]TFD97646.1 hypothetical protein E2491_09495 [Jeotgalibacillus sp. R-1-5s-1]